MIRRDHHSPLSVAVAVRTAGAVSALAAFGLAAFGLGACSSDSSTSVAVPEGVACARTVAASSADAAKAALADASAGTCVVLSAGTYAGPLTVPAGVALVSSSSSSGGGRASISGGMGESAVVALGAGASLVDVDVANGSNIGVTVRGASATVRNVTSRTNKIGALAVLCDAACDAGSVELTDVVLEKSAIGLYVSGASVRMKGGRSAEHGGSSLSGGFGVVAVGGAKITLDGTVVEKNVGTGVVLDGEKTTASLVAATVSENAERGIWVQRAAGTIDAPALRLENTTITKNRIVGVGAFESRGIIIVGGKVSETIAAPLVTNLAKTEDVGDGIGLFGNSSDFKLDGTEVALNARAAGVVDGSERGIIIVGGKVTASASGFKFVVQNSVGADIQIPAADKTELESGQTLGVSAAKLALPSVAP